MTSPVYDLVEDEHTNSLKTSSLCIVLFFILQTCLLNYIVVLCFSAVLWVAVTVVVTVDGALGAADGGGHQPDGTNCKVEKYIWI